MFVIAGENARVRATGCGSISGRILIDQSLQLFGLPDRVHAVLACQRSGARVDDWAHVVFDHGKRRVILHASMLAAGGGVRFVVHGTTGSLVKRGADRQEAQLIEGIRPGNAEWGADPDPLILYDAEGMGRTIAATPGDQSSYYRTILAAVRDGADNPVPGGPALAVMAVLEACVRSAQTGAATELDLSDGERASWT